MGSWRRAGCCGEEWEERALLKKYDTIGIGIGIGIVMLFHLDSFLKMATKMLLRR